MPCMQHTRQGGLLVDLEKIITGMGFTDYLSNAGIQKFSSGGYEVEFLVQRKGGIDSDAVSIREWNVIAQPLPLFRNVGLLWSKMCKCCRVAVMGA